MCEIKLKHSLNKYNFAAKQKKAKVFKLKKKEKLELTVITRK